jgi:hypothetical protein
VLGEVWKIKCYEVKGREVEGKGWGKGKGREGMGKEREGKGWGKEREGKRRGRSGLVEGVREVDGKGR